MKPRIVELRDERGAAAPRPHTHLRTFDLIDVDNADRNSHWTRSRASTRAASSSSWSLTQVQVTRA